MKALKRSSAGRRRTVAAVVAATVVLGGAGAASAVAFADDNNERDSASTSAGAGDNAHATDGTTADTHDDDHDDDHEGDHDGDGRAGAQDDSVDDRTLAASAEVDLKQAVAAATRSLAGTVTEVELEGQPGKAVWKVDIADGHDTGTEVTVDAQTGEVTPALVRQNHMEDEGTDHDREDD
ncbi:PepSY domain-containing protein [Streptomyces sp. NPDC021356]|uniref:PepSY domain-containing protein n=1 Tax=Streptomyces sp. NPDC021356 TaxID=3154900 RepID=UPI0033E2BFAD